MPRVLVVNTGSSSIKYQLFEMDGQKVLASGLVERIGEVGARLTHRAGGGDPLVVEDRVADHSEGFERVFGAFETAGEPIGDRPVARGTDLTVTIRAEVHEPVEWITGFTFETTAIQYVPLSSSISTWKREMCLCGSSRAKVHAASRPMLTGSTSRSRVA